MAAFDRQDSPTRPTDRANKPVGEEELRLRTRRQAIKEAQDIVARYIPKTRDLVVELIAERRDEAARE